MAGNRMGSVGWWSLGLWAGVLLGGTAVSRGEAPAASQPQTATSQSQPAAAPSAWPGYRGPTGDGLSPHVPAALPTKAALKWKKPMKGVVYSGLVAAEGLVVALDHEKDKKDFVICFREDTGEPVWSYDCDNTGEEMDWGSCPRATPVIHDGMVFVLGARGTLTALDLKKGTLVWQKDLVRDFGGTVPSWGYCSSPIFAAGKLITNPGAPAASVVALDPQTGAQAWASPGSTANYGSFLLTRAKGIELLIGYDQEELSARAPADGKVIWSHPLGHTPGYLVPTPAAGTDKLVLCGEDGAHLLSLGGKGQRPEAWEGENSDFVLGDTSPVVVDNMALAYVADKGLTAIDLNDQAKTLWSAGGKEISGDFATLIVGNGRVLVFDAEGQLHLFNMDRKGAQTLGKVKVCGPTRVAPALTAGRLYVRDGTTLYSYELAGGK